MPGPVKAVIFDMDGVLIDSEYLWRRAMIKGFSEFGMQLTEDECRQTMGMRFREVIEIWIKHFQLFHLKIEVIENRVLDLLIQFIESEGRFINGIPEIINYCEEKKILMGLATSSSARLMEAILTKLELNNKLKIAVSAEKLPHGKPHPEVFLQCADLLQVPPAQCLVIEDSLNGVIAARAAQMQVIAVPDSEFQKQEQFAIAHYRFDAISEVLPLLRKLF